MTGESIAGQVELRRLDASVNTHGFRCGLGEIDKWFRRDAIKNHERFRARVTVASLPGNAHPVGFYALSLTIEKISKEERRAYAPELTQSEFASVYLYYTAVHGPFQRNGIGKRLLSEAMRDVYQLGRGVGLPGLTLRAAGSEVASFYERLGFARFGGTDESPRMIMPMRSILEAFDQDA